MGVLPFSLHVLCGTCRRLIAVSPKVSKGDCGSMRYQGYYDEPFGPCITRLRAVSAFCRKSRMFLEDIGLWLGCALSPIVF